MHRHGTPSHRAQEYLIKLEGDLVTVQKYLFNLEEDLVTVQETPITEQETLITLRDEDLEDLGQAGISVKCR